MAQWLEASAAMSLGICLGILGLFNPPSKDFPPTIFPKREKGP